MQSFLETNPEQFLINPELFKLFSYVKKKVYIFNKNGVDYLFVRSIEKQEESFIQKEISQDLLEEKIVLIKNYKKWKEEKCFSKDIPTRSILDFVLIESLLNGISDIHFNITSEEKYEVFVKKNTVLSFFCRLSKAQYESLLLCFKVLSSLDTSKRHLPQSSAFSKIFNGEVVDFRVSTHPTCFGERFVIRVLAKKNVLNYRSMDLDFSVLEIIDKIVSYPNGLVLFTGPTNSGKTTLIHSILQEIAKNNVSIMTLEDPVEYRVPGIIQTNISENGLSFYEGMKSILRQDPDVIFLGEIRDAETAKIAIQAALTGHKVLSTLHAYSVKGAVTRLLDMGISSVVLAESLVSVMSQRLLKKEDKSSNFLGLCPLVDALFFDEAIKDRLRLGEINCIPDNLRDNAEKLLKKGIIQQSELRRVLG